MKKKILIAEWVPSKNKGELAILKGMLKTFETIGSTDVGIFSFEPKEDFPRYPPELKLIDVETELFLGGSLLFRNRFQKIKASLFSLIQHFLFSFLYIIFGKFAVKIMRKSIWKEYVKTDVIIICHDQISCVNGFLLEFSPIYLLFLAKVLKKPLVIYANGFSRISRTPIKMLARMILTKVNLVTLRDPVSLSHLKEIVRNPINVFLTADPVILVEPATPRRASEIFSREEINPSSKMLVGVTLTEELLKKIKNFGDDSFSIFHNVILEFANLFDAIIEKFDADVIFIPHCIEPYKNRDDRIIHNNIYQMMRHASRAKVINNEYSPEEFKGIFRKLHYFIGARIHSVIGALSMIVPSITLTHSQDKRALGLIGRMLKQEEWIFHVETFSSKLLLETFNRLVINSKQIREKLPAIVISIKKKALFNGRYLESMLKMV